MSVKRTIDLTDANDEILEMYKNERGMGYGAMINGLIHTVCLRPENVKNELLSFIKQRLHLLYRKMDQAEEFETRQLMEEAQAYRDLAKYLNDGFDVDVSEAKKTPIMIKIQMLDSYITIPDDWIVLNKEEAAQCEYALVVEVRWRNKTKPIPHFVYFHNYSKSSQYDKTFFDKVNRKCVQAYPEFQEFIDWEKSHHDQELKPDPDNPGQFLNAEAFLEGPQIGHFPVYVQGDRTYCDGEPPYGVCIVRTKGVKL